MKCIGLVSVLWSQHEEEWGASDTPACLLDLSNLCKRPKVAFLDLALENHTPKYGKPMDAAKDSAPGGGPEPS